MNTTTEKSPTISLAPEDIYHTSKLIHAKNEKILRSSPLRTFLRAAMEVHSPGEVLDTAESAIESRERFDKEYVAKKLPELKSQAVAEARAQGKETNPI